MSCLYYYKLQSEFPCDVTKDCKLSTTEIDSNFHGLKLDDVSAATYNSEDMVISIVRNSGEEINIDISSIREDYLEAISEATSGGSSGSTSDIYISGDLDDEGRLILRLTGDGWASEAVIEGFLTEHDVYHDETINGSGKADDPFRIASTERTGYMRNVIAIVDSLPAIAKSGDRYVVRESVNKFGRLYTRNGAEMVRRALLKDGGSWRLPTKEDWDRLLDYAEVCDDGHDGWDIGVEYGDVAGKMLKSVEYWDGNENIDEYGFSVYPSGYVLEGGELVNPGSDARFWTATEYSGDTSMNYVKGFSGDSDKVSQGASGGEVMCSIRLVRDLDDGYVTEKADILGSSYDVVNFREIGQAWTKESIVYNPGQAYSQQFTYDYEGLVSNRMTLYHYNGTYWEARQLMHGDKINVGVPNEVVEYMCVMDNDGNYELVKSFRYVNTGEATHVYLDSGWY